MISSIATVGYMKRLLELYEDDTILRGIDSEGRHFKIPSFLLDGCMIDSVDEQTNEEYLLLDFGE